MPARPAGVGPQPKAAQAPATTCCRTGPPGANGQPRARLGAPADDGQRGAQVPAAASAEVTAGNPCRTWGSGWALPHPPASEPGAESAIRSIAQLGVGLGGQDDDTTDEVRRVEVDEGALRRRRSRRGAPRRPPAHLGRGGGGTRRDREGLHRGVRLRRSWWPPLVTRTLPLATPRPRRKADTRAPEWAQLWSQFALDHEGRRSPEIPGEPD